MLAGATFGAAAFLAASPAQAVCTVTPAGTPVVRAVTCATTTTTNDTYGGVGTTASNRNYSVDTSLTAMTAFTGTVSTGAVVDGFGLAFSNTAGGPNALNVVNNGAVQVNVGNLAAARGAAALNVNATGATPVSYTGIGSVTNLGTAGNGLEISSPGTGNLTAVVGGNVTSAVGGSGILTTSTGIAGNVSVTTATGTTLRGDLYGVDGLVRNVASAGTVTVVNNATVGSLIAAPNTLDYGVVGENLGTGAVSVTNNGAVGLATDRTTNAGVVGSVLSFQMAGMPGVTSAATLGVSGAGAVFSSGFGVLATNLGTGATTVNYTGAVNTTGATGVSSTGTTGAQTVTTGAVLAATDGVVVTSTVFAPALQTINASGVTTGTAGSGVVSNSPSNRIINVGTGGNVTGGTQAILLLGAGMATVINSGIIGAGATGLAINAGTATAPVTVTNNAGATINGRLTLGAEADLVTNAGTISTSGITDFGAGADVLTNSGTLTTTAATTLLGLETLNNSGTITATSGLTFDGGATVFNNTGTLNTAGTIDFGAGADSFTNSGAGIVNLTANTTLVGLETFTNSGRLNFNTFTLTGPALTFTNGSTGFIDTNGNAAIGGFTSFSNAGALDLAAGTFTAPAGAFTNSGTIIADEGATTITGQTTFTNSGTINLQDGATGDFLTINSAFAGSAPGQLRIDTSGAVADRLIVNGAALGSTVVNVNLLSNGFIDPTGVLVVDNVTSSAGAFTLGAVNNSPLLSYALVQRGADFFLTAAPTLAAFQPLSLAGAASDMWYQSADEVISQTRLPHNPDGWAIWGQIYASGDKFNGNDNNQTINGISYNANGNTKNRRYGAQAGVDFGFGGGRIGVTGGYARNKVSSAADLKIKGWNIGVYGQFGGETGFHGEGLFKYDRYKTDVQDGVFAGDNSKFRSTGVDGALGYRFGMGSASIDVNAGVAHVWTKLGGVGNFGFSYDYSKITSTRGRAGVRAVFGSGWRPYVDATVLHEFDGKARVNLFDGVNNYDLDYNGKGTWVRLEGGIVGANSGAGPILAAWADVGDKKGIGARLGFRFGSALRSCRVRHRRASRT